MMRTLVFQIRFFAAASFPMLIKETISEVVTKYGNMRVRVFQPVSEAKVPGIACFTEIYQITGPVERFCRQIASQGYIVASPESYHEFLEMGTVLSYDQNGTDLGNSLKVKKKLDSFDDDSRAVLDLLERLPTCNGKLGATGMCLGGHLAFRCAFDPRVKAAVCYFPTDIHSETLSIDGSDSLKRAKEINGELLMIFGKQDTHIPFEGRLKIAKQLHDDNIVFSWCEFQAQHAFIRDELSKGRYDAALAENCFQLLKNIFFKRLYLGEPVKQRIEHLC
jgi:carboxymethylenebutenolidase